MLSEDALALIPALGYKDAIIFGHDWGAVAAYGAAAASPDRVSKLITAAVGYGSGFFEALATNYAQQRRSWYMFFFQTKIAEAAVSFNDFAFLEKLWTDWSPGWKWAPEDLEALKQSFRATGTLEAALGYYRVTLGPVLKYARRSEIARLDDEHPNQRPRHNVPRPRRRMHRRRNAGRHVQAFPERPEARAGPQRRSLRPPGTP